MTARRIFRENDESIRLRQRAGAILSRVESVNCVQLCHSVSDAQAVPRGPYVDTARPPAVPVSQFVDIEWAATDSEPDVQLGQLPLGIAGIETGMRPNHLADASGASGPRALPTDAAVARTMSFMLSNVL